MKQELLWTAYLVLAKLAVNFPHSHLSSLDSMLSLVEARAVSCPVAMPHGRQTLQGGFSMLIIFEVEWGCFQEQTCLSVKKQEQQKTNKKPPLLTKYFKIPFSEDL